MKIVRFEQDGNVMYGAVEGDIISAINGSIYNEFSIGKELCKLSDVKLLAPVQPRLVVGIGANYRDHLASTGKEIPSEPVVFYKPASSVIGHLDNIICPSISKKGSYAGELAVVIKCTAEHVAEENALDYVLGYTCANDVTANDLWTPISPTRAKAFYTFCPLGPYIVTDVNGDNLRLRSRLNGVLKQDNNTKDMIFSISKIISSVTEFMALEPGDVIITGSSTKGPTTINDGDTIEIEVEGIGTLRNTVIKDNSKYIKRRAR